MTETYCRSVRLTLAALLIIGTCASAAMAGAPEAFKVLAATGKPGKPMKTEGGPDPAGDANEGALAATDKDRANGYVLFARDLHDPVHFNTMPRPDERASKLTLAAARGEFEPVMLGIAALEDLSGVRAVIGPLRSAKDAMIPADQIDIRYGTTLQRQYSPKWLHFPAKTYLAPYLLEKRDDASIARGNAGLVWLTVHVPETATPGTYSGALTLSIEGKSDLRVPVELTVLPIQLVAPERAYLVSAHPDWGKSGFGFKDVDMEMTRKFFVDLRAHGVTHYGGSIRVRGVRADKITDEQIMAEIEKADALAKLAKESGLQQAFVAFYVDAICKWTRPWFTYFPITDELDTAYVRLVKIIAAEGKKRNWGPIYIMSGDEPGGHPATMKPIRHYLELLKAQAPEVKTVLCIGGGMRRGGIAEYQAMRKGLDLPITSMTRTDLLDAIRADGKPFWIYGSAGNGPATQRSSRHRPGFYAAKVKPAGALMWCYHWFVGYTAGEGPVPTIPWEMVREGIDDARYVATLEALIARAARSPKPGARKAAARAKEDLDAILQQVGPVYGDWSKGKSTNKEGEIPPAASVTKWRSAIAREILRLQAMMVSQP